MLSNKNAFIKILQFINEAILIYFIIYPFCYWFASPPIISDYLVLVVVSSILFFAMNKISSAYIAFMLLVPVMVLIGTIFLGFSIYVSAILAIAFVYRFIKQLEDEYREHEKNILVLGIIFAIIEALIFKTDTVLWMVVFHFTVILTGYVFKQNNLNNTSNSDYQSQFVKGSLLITTGVIVICSVIFLFYGTIYNIVSYIYTLIAKGFLYFLTLVVNLIEILGLDLEPLRNAVDSKLNGLKPNINVVNNRNFSMDDQSWITNHTCQIKDTLYWTGIIGVFVILLVIFIVFFKRKLVIIPSEETSYVTHTKLVNERTIESRKNVYRFFKRKPNERARQLFFDFEKYAHKKGIGRKTSETIEEWFIRTNLPVANVELYQKVRYGEEGLSSEELHLLSEEISLLKEIIKKRND